MAAVAAIGVISMLFILAVLVLIAGLSTVLGMRLITRDSRPRVRYLVALSAILTLVFTQIVMIAVSEDDAESTGTTAVVAAKEAAHRQLRFEIGILLIAATLIPGFLWSINRPSEADTSDLKGSTSHRPLVVYFALGPILLPIGWVAAQLLFGGG